MGKALKKRTDTKSSKRTTSNKKKAPRKNSKAKKPKKVQPKKTPKMESPKAESPKAPEPKRDPKLVALEKKSEQIQHKLEVLNERRDRTYSNKGFDHPAVAKLNTQIRKLGRQL